MTDPLVDSSNVDNVARKKARRQKARFSMMLDAFAPPEDRSLSACSFNSSRSNTSRPPSATRDMDGSKPKILDSDPSRSGVRGPLFELKEETGDDADVESLLDLESKQDETEAKLSSPQCSLQKQQKEEECVEENKREKNRFFTEEVTTGGVSRVVKRRTVVVEVHPVPKEKSEKRQERRRCIVDTKHLTLSPRTVNGSLTQLEFHSPLKNLYWKKPAVINLEGWSSSFEEERKTCSRASAEIYQPQDSSVNLETRKDEKDPGCSMQEEGLSIQLEAEVAVTDDRLDSMSADAKARSDERMEEIVGEVVKSVSRENSVQWAETAEKLLLSETNGCKSPTLSNSVVESSSGDDEDEALEEVEARFCEEEPSIKTVSAVESPDLMDTRSITFAELQTMLENAEIQKSVEADNGPDEVMPEPGTAENNEESQFDVDIDVPELKCDLTETVVEDSEEKKRPVKRRRRASVFGKRRKPKKRLPSPKQFEVIFERERAAEVKSILRTAKRIRRSAHRTLVRSRERRDRVNKRRSGLHEVKKVGFRSSLTKTILITPRSGKIPGEYNMPNDPPKTIRALPHFPIDPSDSIKVRLRTPNPNRNEDFKFPAVPSEKNAQENRNLPRKQRVPSMFLRKRKPSPEDDEVFVDDVVVEKEVVKRAKVNMLPSLKKEDSMNNIQEAAGKGEKTDEGSKSLCNVSKFLEQEKDRAPFGDLQHVNWEFGPKGNALEVRPPWKLKSEEDFFKMANPDLKKIGEDLLLKKAPIVQEQKIQEKLTLEELNKMIAEIQNVCGLVFNPCMLYDSVCSILKEKSEVPWSRLMAPKTSADYLENSKTIDRLKAWMGRFQNRKKKQPRLISERKRRPKNRRRSRYRLESNCTSDSDEDSEFSEDDSSGNPLALVSGPRSSGKTSIVHTLGEELGFKVMELNCGDCRSGTQVRSLLKGALDTHRVHRVLSSSQETPSSPPSIFGMFKQKGNKEKEADITSRRGRHKRKKVLEEEKESSGVQKRGSSLILLDDVDILFEKDEGFWGTVRAFSSESMVPVILTCSDVNLAQICDKELRDISFAQFSFETVKSDIAMCYLQVVNLASTGGVPIVESHLRNLYEKSGRDLRQCLMQIQFWKSHREPVPVDSVFGEPAGLTKAKYEFASLLGNRSANFEDSANNVDPNFLEHRSLFDSAFSGNSERIIRREFARNLRIVDGLSDSRGLDEDLGHASDIANRFFGLEACDLSDLLASGGGKEPKWQDVQTLAAALVRPPKEERMIYESEYWLASNECLSCDIEPWLRDIVFSCKRIILRRKELDYFKRIGLDSNDKLKELYSKPRFEVEDLESGSVD